MENKKSFFYKASTFGVVAAVAITTSISGVLGEVSLNQVFSYGYGSHSTGSVNSNGIPKVEESDKVSIDGETTTSEENKKEDTKKDATETDTKDTKKDNKKEDVKKVENNRVMKTLGDKKYSTNNKVCPISNDIANPNFRALEKVSFKDISSSKYESSIKRLARVNSEFNEPIVHGTTPTTFEPTRGITRAEFLAIVLQSHCIDIYKTATSTTFTDLTVGDWKTNVVEVALKQNIIAGDVKNGKKVFRPNDTISKIEAMAILISMKDIKLEKDYTHSYTDAAADWQNDILAKIEYLELEPKSNKFHPNSTIARDAMSDYLVKTIELY